MVESFEPIQSDLSTRIDPRGLQSRLWAITFLGSGVAILLLMTAILVAEALGWPDDYYHLPQLLCTITCVVSAIQYLRSRSGKGPRALAGLAWIALALAFLWLVFILLLIIYGLFVMEPLNG